MSTFTDIEPALLGPETLSAILSDKISGASTEATNAVAQALASGDQNAYDRAHRNSPPVWLRREGRASLEAS